MAVKCAGSVLQKLPGVNGWFSTKRRADGEAEQIRSRIEKYGEIGRLLSTENLVDAAKAVALLSNHVPGTTLKAAALEYIAAHNERNASVPMAELFDAFAVAKADAANTIFMRCAFTVSDFAPLDKVIARDLKHRKIDECLAGFGGRSSQQ
jgi:hypothetical protein